jgi:hypothetical protein
MELHRRTLLGGLGVLAAGLPCAPAVARSGQQPEDAGSVALRALYGDLDAAQPPFVTYETEAGQRRFSIDRSQPGVVLFQLTGEDEVWALRSRFGVRDDEFLRNDVGEIVLRITALGGATLYLDGDTVGIPASVASRGRPLLRPAPSGRTLQQVVENAVPELERFAPRRSLRVEAAGGLPPPLVEDGLRIAAIALSRLPRGWFGVRPRRLRRLRAVAARAAYARFSDGYLELGLQSGVGYAGRPSSLAIRRALEAGR